MITAAFEYARPGSVDEAQALLNKFGEDAKVIAGGQSLIPLMRLRLSQPTALIDIQGIGELKQIRRDNGSVEIGALVRHIDIQRSATLRETSRFSWRWPTTWATTRCATSEPSAA